MNDFDWVARILGLALLLVGGAVVVLAGWILITGRRPDWVRTRQSLKEQFVRLWALSALLSGLGAIAIGSPYVLGYPVHGAALLLQASGFALIAGAAVCWGFIIARSGYRTP